MFLCRSLAASLASKTTVSIAGLALCLVVGSRLPLKAGGDELSSKEAKALIGHAQSPRDHERLANYYERLASRFEAEAKEYDAMAERYRRQPTADEYKHPMSGRTAGHSAYMAGRYWRKAEKLRGLAGEEYAAARTEPQEEARR